LNKTGPLLCFPIRSVAPRTLCSTVHIVLGPAHCALALCILNEYLLDSKCPLLGIGQVCPSNGQLHIFIHLYQYTGRAGPERMPAGRTRELAAIVLCMRSYGPSPCRYILLQNYFSFVVEAPRFVSLCAAYDKLNSVIGLKR